MCCRASALLKHYEPLTRTSMNSDNTLGSGPHGSLFSRKTDLPDKPQLLLDTDSLKTGLTQTTLYSDTFLHEGTLSTRVCRLNGQLLPTISFLNRNSTTCEFDRTRRLYKWRTNLIEIVSVSSCKHVHWADSSIST